MSSLPAVYVIDSDANARERLLVHCAALAVHAVGFASADAFLHSGTVSFPGCIVSEIDLPGMSGLELQVRLARDRVPLPFVFVTARVAVVSIVQAMKQGAVTVLAKSASRSELETALREALELSQKWRAQAQSLSEMQVRLANLSLGERQVLDLILAGQTNKAIAKRLDVAVRTVEARRQQIFRKTSTGSLAELVRFALACTGEGPGENHSVESRSN